MLRTASLFFVNKRKPTRLENNPQRSFSTLPKDYLERSFPLRTINERNTLVSPKCSKRLLFSAFSTKSNEGPLLSPNKNDSEKKSGIHSSPSTQSKKRLTNTPSSKPLVEWTKEEVKQGKIAKFNSERGFGFIKDSETRRNVFFHVKESNVRDAKSIVEGATVLFKSMTVATGHKHQGKERATDVVIVPNKPLGNWGKEEVLTWFLSSKYADYAKKFSLDGKDLAGLTEAQFQKPLGDIQGSALYNAVQALKGEKEKPTSTELFGPNITGYKRSTGLNIELPFQNRENEIESMARVCLENLRVAMMESPEKSQEKTTLLTSAQMWGSGKSWLGMHFLQQFNSPQFATLRSKLAEEFGIEAVNTLANSVYIVIDFRNWEDMLLNLPAGRLDLFVLRSLVGTMITYFPEDRAFWESQPESKWLPRTVLHWFSEKYNKTFFVHFDEVDLILEVPPELTRDEVVGIEAAKRFYAFWRFTHSIILTRHFLYFTGRSVFLFAYGKGLYHSPDFKSPGNNSCLLLDTLKPQHIENILAKNPGIEDADTRKYLASLLYHRTGGIPRFIGFAIPWLHKQGIGKDSKKEHISVDIFGDEFRDFVRKDKKAQRELNPMDGFGDSPRIHQLYARLIALSALGVPLDINATITNPETWGIRKDGRNKYLEVPILDVLRLYNLWIEESPSDGQWRIVFPDLVLDEIAYFNRPKGELQQRDEIPGWISALPYWIAFSKTRSAEAWDKGTLLERIAANNMELAILDNLGIAKKSATFEERFPFLSQSSIGKEAAVLSSSSPYGQLPKIVTRDKGQGSAVPLDSLSKEEREERLELFRNYVARAPSFLREEIRLFKEDWKYLLKIVRPGILYIPAAKSASGDLIYFTSTLNSVQFQFKATKDPLTMGDIIEEAKKACVQPLVADGRKLTFVVVALKVNYETIKKKATPESVVQVSQGEQNLSIVLQSGAKLEGTKGETWEIPENVDIVIVLEKGLEQLVTKHNLKLFEGKRDVTIEDFVVNNK